MPTTLAARGLVWLVFAEVCRCHVVGYTSVFGVGEPIYCPGHFNYSHRHAVRHGEREVDAAVFVLDGRQWGRSCHEVGSSVAVLVIALVCFRRPFRDYVSEEGGIVVGVRIDCAQ